MGSNLIALFPNTQPHTTQYRAAWISAICGRGQWIPLRTSSGERNERLNRTGSITACPYQLVEPTVWNTGHWQPLQHESRCWTKTNSVEYRLGSTGLKEQNGRCLFHPHQHPSPVVRTCRILYGPVSTEQGMWKNGNRAVAALYII